MHLAVPEGQPLIFINSVKKYTLSLALRMTIDSTGGTVAWNQIMAMSIATTGIKG